MSYPLILPYEEQDERHKFSNFLWRVFDPARETNTQFEGSLTAEALFNIYKTYKVDTMLTTDMIAHTIMYGGYMTAQGELYFRIKPDIFKDLPAATQEKILSYCNYAKSLSLRQIMMGHDPAAVDRGMVLNESFRHFIQTQIFTPTFKFWKSIPKGQRKTSTKELYEYYSWWCFQFGYKPEDKASFLNLCKNLGYKIKRGYYKGVSGGNIVENVVIPQTEEERKLTIQYEGLGVICLQGYTLFNDSTATKDYTKLGLKAYIQSRRCISSAKSYAEKKRQKEKEKQQQALSNRSRTEISQNSLSGRAQKVSQAEERRADRGYNEKDEQLTQTNQSTSIKHSENKSSTTIGTEGRVTTNRTPALTGNFNRHADTKDRRQDTKINSTKSGGSVSGNHQKIPAVELPLTGAAKKAFYTGLRVTYRLAAPGTFNFSKFEDEIDKANLGVLSEEQKRYLYEDFLKTLKK